MASESRNNIYSKRLSCTMGRRLADEKPDMDWSSHLNARTRPRRVRPRRVKSADNSTPRIRRSALRELAAAADWSKPKRKCNKVSRNRRVEEEEENSSDDESSTGWSSSEEENSDSSDSESISDGDSDSDSESESSDSEGEEEGIDRRRKHGRKMLRSRTMQSQDGRNRRDRKKTKPSHQHFLCGGHLKDESSGERKKNRRVKLTVCLSDHRYLPSRQSLGYEDLRVGPVAPTQKQRSLSLSHNSRPASYYGRGNDAVLGSATPQIPNRNELGYEDIEPAQNCRVRTQSMTCSAPASEQTGERYARRPSRRSSHCGDRRHRRMSEAQAQAANVIYDQDYEDQRSLLAALSRRSIAGRAGRAVQGGRVQQRGSIA